MGGFKQKVLSSTLFLVNASWNSDLSSFDLQPRSLPEVAKTKDLALLFQHFQRRLYILQHLGTKQSVLWSSQMAVWCADLCVNWVWHMHTGESVKPQSRHDAMTYHPLMSHGTHSFSLSCFNPDRAMYRLPMSDAALSQWRRLRPLVTRRHTHTSTSVCTFIQTHPDCLLSKHTGLKR